ncbi:hypothetical protein [Oceanirhabdus seepicola]|uniref:Uncharacterized protein n=1 Tax=Oceanirhabdus seepicola TaxID=2828781 RepID=A0A9J6P4X9_9CLOT|nr:hypothetical protein [Oceanirhabdus seepicola]MCM1991284.1 hypothetical protein [Oceanirhabdus seepicola]
MKNRFFVILRDNKMLININDQSNIVEYSFTDLETYPNIPFYINIFETENVRKKIKPIVYENLNTLSEKIFKPEVFVLVDDDTMGTEKRAIEEFILLSLAPKKVAIVPQCLLLAPKDIEKYIAVSKSCRLIILSYIKNRKVLAQKFIDNKEYSVEELKELIRNLHDECKLNKLNIYLNGTHLKKYAEIGKVIDIYELLNNTQNLLLNS